jgi:outer membrane protein TolC
VAMEVKRMYYAHLYARSLMPTLRNVAEIVSGASEQAQELYAENTGKVTKADLMRLEYASIEVEKLRLRAKDGAELALAALKHTMGWPMGRALVVDRKKLPRVPKGDAPDLASLIHQSAAQRPEWAQLKHGEKAAIALEAAERLANAPVLFLAGRLELDWAPTRQDTPNPYHFDEFNDFSGGLALGLLFNLDPALAAAKGDEAAGIRAEVLALRRFAATGIPLQVRKAHDEVRQAAKVAKLSRKAVKVTRRWVTFSALAHQSGTGEAKELLEGVAAWVTAKNDYYDALRAYYTARAELDYAVGQIMGPKVPGT